MPHAAYLAFDLGASSGRAVLGRLDGAVMRMEEIHRFPTPIIERGEHLFWDIDALWDELKLGFRKALDAAPGLRSVSVDSWAVDYVPLDAEGEPLRLPYCYRDPRTDGMMEQAFATLSPRTIYGRTGIQFLPFNTLFQLLADKRDDPDLLRRTRSHLLIADYFNYRFSGRQAVECTNASTTQFMKVGSPTWDDALFYAFDLDPAAWPEIVPAGTPLGPCLAKLGVTVVASCSHDTGSAVAAAPATGDDWAFVSCGTWSLLGAVRDRADPHGRGPRSRVHPRSGARWDDPLSEEPHRALGAARVRPRVGRHRLGSARSRSHRRHAEPGYTRSRRRSLPSARRHGSPHPRSLPRAGAFPTRNARRGRPSHSRKHRRELPSCAGRFRACHRADDTRRCTSSAVARRTGCSANSPPMPAASASSPALPRPRRSATSSFKPARWATSPTGSPFPTSPASRATSTIYHPTSD